MKPWDAAALGLQGVTGQFIGADDRYLVELETVAGFGLPDRYKEFLARYGASLFHEDVVFLPIVLSPWAVDGMESLDVFYGASETPQFDVRRVNTRLRGVLPPGTIAIAHDSGSNLVVLDSHGEIHFMDRDTGRLSLCARDFDSFLASFRVRYAGQADLDGP